MLTNRRQFIRNAIRDTSALAALTTVGSAGAARAATGGPPPFVLLVYASGGWDPTMVFDPKIGQAAVSGEAGSVVLSGAGGMPFVHHPSRPAVRKFFETYGASAAIVNGLSVGAMDRKAAAQTVLSTVPPGRLRPVDWLSHYAANLNPVVDLPHIVIDAPYMPGDLTKHVVYTTTARMAEYTATAIPGTEPLGAAGETALAAFQAKALLDRSTEAALLSLDGEKLRALYHGQAREAYLTKHLTDATTALGAAGSDSAFVRNGKIAVELFASGASQCATVQAGNDGAWETRTNHFARQTKLWQELFTGITAILNHATARGVGGRVLLVVMSERGRSPRLDAQGGKAAWPYTSMLLWGPGIRGGTVAGATDAYLRGVAIDPVFGTPGGKMAVTMEPAHVMAAIYLQAGIPVKLILPNHPPMSQILAGGT